MSNPVQRRSSQYDAGTSASVAAARSPPLAASDVAATVSTSTEARTS